MLIGEVKRRTAFFVSHRIHVCDIDLYIWHRFIINVGEYTIQYMDAMGAKVGWFFGVTGLVSFGALVCVGMFTPPSNSEQIHLGG